MVNVALGGTFDPIHDGHRKLFEKAFSLGDLTVGLTSDALAPETRSQERYVRPFEERRAALDAELDAISGDRTYEIRVLEEPTGIAVEPGFDALVLTPETEPVGREINELREERGLDAIEIVVVERLRAEDDGIVSSTRIVNGEIDEHGNLTPGSTGRPTPE